MRVRLKKTLMLAVVLALWPLLGAAILSGGLAYGQVAPVRFGTPPQLPSVVAASDAQAVAILSKVLSAAGGSQALGPIQDFTASGQITYSWAGQPVQGSVTLRGRGLEQFRMDAALPEGTRSWAVSHGIGKLGKADGTSEAIPGHNAINLGSLTFPYLWLSMAVADPHTTVSTVGTVEVSGVRAIQVRVQRHYAASFDPHGTIAQLTTRDFFIDPVSSLVLKVELMTHPLKTFSISLPEDLYFSNYQRVNGVMVPFSISDTVNGQQTWSIQLSSIQFNSGLSDSDFSM
jgi:hypothetical protein